MKRLLALLLALAPTMAVAAPDTLARVDTEFVKAGIVAEDAVLAPGTPSRLALAMDIQSGWHTYWKNSGDSGQAVEITWTAPEGVEIGAFKWPAPHRQPFPPMMNYGYSDRAVFTMPVSVGKDWPAGKPVDLKAEVYWLVCEMVCIPERGEVSFSIPTGETAVVNGSAADLFREAEEMRAAASPFEARYEYDGTNLSLRFDGVGFDADTLEDAYFYPSEWGLIDHAATQVATTDPEGLTLVIPKSTEEEPAPEGTIRGVLELVERTGGDDTATLSLAVVSEPGSVVGASASAGFTGIAGSSMSVATAILFAFIGGLILNLMPCVFPVLALKAIGFAATAHESTAKRLSHGIAYTLGVLTLFVVLAAVLIALKEAGAMVGWGFQLQNPLIVAALAYLLLLVGLNLSGVFEVNASAAGAGEGMASSGGARGAYFTGALAAIVATPCTAPFMATALGAALTMSTPATMAIFVALGLGLAAPFLLLSVLPGVASRMPKPGMWMVRLKELLAFPMYASAAWLLTVLGTLAGPGSMLVALIGAVLVGLAAWAFGAAQQSAGRGKVLGYGTSVAALVAVVALCLQFTLVQPSDKTAIAGHAGPVEPFTAARLDALIAAKEPVFLNMTADWCITCKVNEKMAFGSDFQTALEDNGVTYLVGDWTARDPEITELLQKFGRVGVPLYAIFPREGDPVLLPQILTSDRIVEALGKV